MATSTERSRWERDESALGDDGHSALDALWHFEATHHFLLANELATRHAGFVDAFYAALEHTRELVERQSERVLAVLYDKDARIHELEEELRNSTQNHAKLIVKATQTPQKPEKKHRSVQCDADNSVESWEAERISMQQRIDAQQEQIEVLLDELERIQAVLSDTEKQTNNTTGQSATQYAEVQQETTIIKTETVSRCTQTDTEATPSSAFDAGEALAAISNLQQQLSVLEMNNAALQAKLTREDHSETELGVIEWQLSDALEAMEHRVRRCLPGTMHLEPASCLELHHRLQAVALERDQLMDELLVQRTSSSPPQPSQQLARLPKAGYTMCENITCHHTLRRLLSLVRQRQKRERDHSAAEKKKTLRSEIHKALHGGTMDVATQFVARLSMTWMDWDVAHTQEVATLHHELQAARERCDLQVTRLVDELHRVNQVNMELQTRSAGHSSKPQLQITDGEATDSISATVETNRRVLELELALKTKDEQLAVANRAIEAMSGHSQEGSNIVQLSTELQTLQAQHFDRLQPRDLSSHAIVEYFRLEKECLRLTHRLREREEELQQAKATCGQLEKAIAAASEQQFVSQVDGTADMTSDMAQRIVTRLHSRYLLDENSQLKKELSHARSRIVILEQTQQQPAATLDTGTRKMVRRVVSKLEDHHSAATTAFRDWQKATDGSTTEPASTSVLLSQYEDLCLQFRVLEQVVSSPAQPLTSSQNEQRERWRLMDKLRLMEARLLRAQTCVGCGSHVTTPPVPHTMDKSIATSPITVQSTATQTNRHRRVKTQGIQVELVSKPPPLPDQQTDDPAVAPATAMKWAALNRQLELALTRIDELTQQKETLSQRHAQQRTDHDRLLVTVREMEATNATLSSQVREFQAASSTSTAAAPPLPPPAHVVREQEVEELVRQLCAMRERCATVEKLHAEAAAKLTQVEATVARERSRREDDEAKRLEAYMGKVNQSLAAIERERERVSLENRQLQERVKEMEMAVAIREARGTHDSGTATDAAMEDASVFQEMETRVVVVQNELAAAQQEIDSAKLRDAADKMETERALASEREQLQHERATMEETRTAYHSLRSEFDEAYAAFAEARDAADARILFLAKCVDECSRLVDAGDRHVSGRDLYDTVVLLSKRVASVVTTTKSTTVKHKTLLATSDSLTAQLQADMWRVRCGKLEASVRGATLKTKSCEDMVDRLELEMVALKGEVKDRMAREAALIAKDGQLRVELAGAKAQCATLTSRLTEACSELKRSQDAAKIADTELHRLRTAVQRKTELLTSQKHRTDEMATALDSSQKRVAQLEPLERALSAAQSKVKDQGAQLQELRQQCAMYKDSTAELGGQVEKHKDAVAAAQARVKQLKLETSMIREQLKEMKKGARAIDHQTSSGQDPESKSVVQNPAIDALTAQVKGLQRRVLQKQEVILAYKTKMAELDAEIVTQRTKLFDLAQANRQLQQVHREKEQSVVQGVAQLKKELEGAVSSTSEQLDGLRASIFDACEVFVHCAPPKIPSAAPSLSGSDSGSSTWPEDDQFPDMDFGTRRATTDDLLLELRRYAELTPDDLAQLRITKRPSSSERHAAEVQKHESQAHTRKRGELLLSELERALEMSPQDCRQEICHVLEFLSGGEMRTISARRY